MKKKGISLIVLLITIIVLIILSGTVIIGIKTLNIHKIEEVVSESSMKTYREELSNSINDVLSKDENKSKIDINEIEYEQIKKYIPSLKEEHKDKFIILEGELVSSKMRVPTPIIKEGMTPIKWDEKGREVETTVKDPNWYNYNRKKWANAKTKDGSYWVWIPRFAYKITYYPNEKIRNEVKASPKNGDKQLDKIVAYSDARGFVNKEGKIITEPLDDQVKLSGIVDIKFVGLNEYETKDNYIIHPAFSAYRRKTYNKDLPGNFGWDEDIPGFWISKFEMTKAEDNKFKSIPGVPLVDYSSELTIFEQGRNLSNVIFNGATNYDSMNITNTQWGAMAYLTDAKGFLPNGNFSESTPYSGGGNGNKYKGNTHLTTTGNITGIYDINGGRVEDVSALGNDERFKDLPNQKIYFSNKNTRYVDVYRCEYKKDGYLEWTSYFNPNKDKYGDAIFETSIPGSAQDSGWYDSIGFNFDSSLIVFSRGGGKYKLKYGSGGPFSYDRGPNNSGWRATLVPMK